MRELSIYEIESKCRDLQIFQYLVEWINYSSGPFNFIDVKNDLIKLIGGNRYAWQAIDQGCYIMNVFYICNYLDLVTKKDKRKFPTYTKAKKIPYYDSDKFFNAHHDEIMDHVVVSSKQY
jgi:hypothetical protein